MDLDQPKLRREITDKIAAAWKSGISPFRPKYSQDQDPNHYGIYKNCVTREEFRGINLLLLRIASEEKQYTSKWWATAKQWKRLRGEVAHNENPTIIFLHSAPMKRMHEGRKRVYFFFRKIEVYNLAQIEGPSVDYLRTSKDKLNKNDAIREAKKIIKATNADIRKDEDTGNYTPYARYLLPQPIDKFPNHTEGDYIEMPQEARLFEKHDYYETLFHELAHWAEARTGWVRFEGSNTYEMGELVAIMAACIVQARIGMRIRQYSPGEALYMPKWLEAMEKDYDFIFKAANQAYKTADYIMKNYQPPRFDY